MPPKKRTKKTLLQETEEKIEAEIRQKPELCNHQNKHYTAGVLTCVLPPNHGGDHLGYVNGRPTAWSDAAGTPARKHK